MSLFSSTKQHLMASMPATATLAVLLLSAAVSLSLCTPFGVSGDAGLLDCLKVPPAEFAGSVRKAVDVLHDVASTLQSDFSNGFADSRLSSAVSACLELVDLSSDELRWALSATESPKGIFVLVGSHTFLSLAFSLNPMPATKVTHFLNGKHYSTGNPNSDLRTWLSAVLANTDTCMEGFEGASRNVKGLISNSIDKVSSLVQKLLTQVHPISVTHITTKQGQFPSWVEPGEQNLLLGRRRVHVDAVVAADGSGNYTTVMDAVLAAPEYRMKRYVIRIKKGVYEENVEIDKKKWNLVMIGDGMHNTVITGNLSYQLNLTTFKTATFAVNAIGFIARGISFRNTAGPQRHQAVALRSDSDLSVFYRCGIFGYQDSLYAHALRQFYRECIISGTVDFIFGNAIAVFQNCTILAKKGLPKQKNTITAQGGKDPSRTSGFSIQFCNISADSDLLPSVNDTQTYLGRPWKPYSLTVFMQSYMSDVLRPEGWAEWNGSSYLDTLYYGEFMNYGPGAGVASRVKWPGYHVMNDSSQASNFTVANLILGDLWLPSTGVAYTPGL